MKAIVLVASLLLGNSNVVRFSDGSVVHGKIQIQNIEVETAYGKLTVPWTDVQQITFGNRPDSKTALLIEKYVKNLGTSNYGERDAAHKALVELGPMCVRSLLGPHQDAETEKRASMVIAAIKERWASRWDAVAHDTIETSTFSIMGKVSLETWTIESSALGSMKVERQSMSWLGCRSGETLVTVMADGKWVQTKVSVGKDASVSVKAEGQVDIRPQQGPSTYLVSPKGYNAVGTGSSFMGGALIGKVGAGDPFVIGESTEFTTRHSGPLFLMIVPSPWNCHSSGSYNVKIRQERR